MSARRAMIRWGAASFVAFALVVATTTASAVAAVPGQSSTDGTRTLTVSQATGLDPAGQTVQVEGAGYDPSKGVYVAFCVARPPGTVPEPCGGVGATSATWVSSNAPSYGTGLATAYGPGGTFSVPVGVSPTIGTFDCREVQCAVVTRNDHTRSTDRSQDVVVAVNFAGAPLDLPLTTVPPSTSNAPTESVKVRPVASDPRTKLPVTVTSSDGKKAKVTSADRIVALNGSIAEIVYSLGLGSHVVGRDVSTTFSEASAVPLVTRAHEVSAESVLSRRPTVVLAQSDVGPPDAVQHIRDAGVPVVLFDEPSSIARIGGREVAVAEALGVRPLGALLRARTQTEIKATKADIPKRGDKPVVAFLYLRGQAGVYLIGGKGSGADAMIRAAGGIDAGTKMGLDEQFTPITSEALVAAAPDVILVTTTGLESVGGIDGLVKIPGIAQTPAGANRRVIAEEDGLLFSFGSRTPTALAQLAEKLQGATESLS